jgi:RNA polymerase-binding transcription factor DksA
MKNKTGNWMRKKILVKALSKNLDKMSKSTWVRSLKDGKDLICPYCDQPVKPCEKDPSVMCEKMLRSGTEGKEIEDALKNPVECRYGICISCGKRISTAHLKKHPTAELCTCCVKKGHKIRVKKAARAAAIRLIISPFFATVVSGLLS